jgi:hypothetical protein
MGLGAAMPVITPAMWLAIVGAGSAAAGTGYTIKSGEDARSVAEDEAGRQERANNKAIEDARVEQDKQKKLEAETIANSKSLQESASARLLSQKKRNIMATTRAGTILTSPLGTVGGGNTGGRKSLLGQ